MNRLTIQKRVQVISALVEGNSIRSVVRMTGVAMNTIQKLLADLGKACTEYQDNAMRNLPCKRIQCDEIWQFCYAKEKNVPADKRGQFGYGDVWTWVALDADTKLVPSWCVGTRDAGTAFENALFHVPGTTWGFWKTAAGIREGPDPGMRKICLPIPITNPVGCGSDRKVG